MADVRPKKNLGQHFLTDLKIAQDIVAALKATEVKKVLEIGPGMGVLTQYLLENDKFETHVVEIDTESVVYLKNHFPKLEDRILNEDFLSYPLEQFSTEKIAIIGNFPYNISSQIFFRVLDYRDQVTEVVCMLQKEVAERLTGKPGGREYGILTILLQAFYHTEYLFTVHEDVFNPPPKVKSGVIRITRNESAQLDCDELLFKKIIKTAFGQRRKTMRNTLKTFVNYAKIPAETLSRRPEELSVDEFVTLTKILM